jgi:hypothetical protein
MKNLRRYKSLNEALKHFNFEKHIKGDYYVKT